MPSFLSLRLHITGLNLINWHEKVPSDTPAQDINDLPNNTIRDLRRHYSLSVALMDHRGPCEYFKVSNIVLCGVEPPVGLDAKK